jgi:hypothetical protein
VLESCPGTRSAGVSHVVIEIELNLKHLGPNFPCNIYTIVPPNMQKQANSSKIFRQCPSNWRTPLYSPLRSQSFHLI